MYQIKIENSNYQGNSKSYNDKLEREINTHCAKSYELIQVIIYDI